MSGARLRTSARGHAGRACPRGLTLVELLVAVSVSVVALAAAWPCVWNGARTAFAVDARAQAGTTAASALRRVAADLRATTVLLPVPSGRDPRTAIHIRHHPPDGPAENVLIAWDPLRGVLWRKASASYVADRVEAFDLTYYGADGAVIAPDALRDAAPAATVMRVRVRLVVTAGNARVERFAELPVGPR